MMVAVAAALHPRGQLHQAPVHDLPQAGHVPPRLVQGRESEKSGGLDSQESPPVRRMDTVSGTYPYVPGK